MRMVNNTLFEYSTTKRLIVGIVAGLTLEIGDGDCACCFGGFGVYAGSFFRGAGCGNGGGAGVDEILAVHVTRPLFYDNH